jgi:glycosyltransferase involved in cell wall biosynthesis
MNPNGASISVIVPVYNGALFLREAIDSAQRQTLQPSEILVVDDGSTDNSAAVARESGRNVRCLLQDHAGPAAARNLGLRSARGEFIAFLDADDLWPADKLADQLNALAGDPSAGMVFGRIQCLKQSSAEAERPAYSAFGQTWSWCLLGAALVRRTVFDRTGLFDPSLRYGEDLDWFLRAVERGARVTQIEQTCLFYRIHGANMTRGVPHTGFGLTRILKHHLDRKRAAGPSGSSGGRP